MAINIFNHPYKAEVNRKLEPIVQTLRTGDRITAFHTPVVLPLTGSGEIGGYARSIGLPFGPKWIALNCDRFSRETPSMQEFILSRQVALFDKPSRYLHIPLAAIVVAVGSIASSILFPSSAVAAAVVIIGIATLSANFIAKKEQENEKYADLAAFRNCTDPHKENILQYLQQEAMQEINAPRSFIKNNFSSYPSYTERYNQLVKDEHTSHYLKQHFIATDVIHEAMTN